MNYFFDLDATLLDHEASQRGGLEHLGSFAPGLRAQLHEDFLRVWSDVEAKHFRRFEKGELTIEQHRRERLKECFPDFCSPLSENELDSLYQVYLQGYAASWSLYPEALDVLSNITGPKALITNGDSKLQRAKVERLGLGDFFRGIFISGELGFAKPDPRIFIAACDELKLPPQDVHYVGDNFRNDIEGAASAGLKPVWINRDSVPRPNSDISYREIRSLSELTAATP